MQTTSQTVNGREGAKQNQGSRPLNGEAKTVRITITLTEDDLVLLDRLSPFFPTGAGNARERNHSEGVRWALRALHREQKALLKEVQRITKEIEADPSLIVTEEELERDIAAKIADIAQQVKPMTHVEN